MGWQTPDFWIPPERDYQDPREQELAEQAREECPVCGRVISETCPACGEDQ